MRASAHAALPDGDHSSQNNGVARRLRRSWATLLSLVLVAAMLTAPAATASTPAAQAPVADAGADLTATVGQPVALDGTGSSDADGDDLTYAWSLLGPQPGNYTQSMDDPSSATPSFTPALIGTYTATLVVSDGTQDSVADTVDITVTDGVEVSWQCEGVSVTAPVRISRVVVAQGDEHSRHTAGGTSWSLSETEGITAIWVSVRGNDSGEGPGYGTRFDRPVPDPCPPANTAPVADAGADQSAITGDTVALDGTGSTDPDGDDLTYAWSLASPSGSTTDLEGSDTAQPTFAADVSGTYTAELIVNDGTTDSPTDSVTITVNEPANQAPTANAGNDQSATTGDTITLDGTGSTDPERDPLTYAWSLAAPDGSTATLDDPTASQPRFIPDVAGAYVAELTVNDGTIDSAPDSVTITVSEPPNQVPVANAGTDQEGIVGDTITLDGTSSSDPDGDTLTYAWSLAAPDGSTATLDDPTASQPLFIPDVAGDFTAELVVNDGTDDSPADAVTITVNEPPNQAPIAEIVLMTDGAIGERLTLLGYHSNDPDGDDLTYTWDFQTPEGSTATLEHPIPATTRFVPDVVGTYTITLVVNDGSTDSAPEILILTIGHRPVAEAGPHQSAETGDTVTLDGTGSTDPDGDELSYQWYLRSPTGSDAALDDPTSATPSFTPDITGRYTVDLVVNDGRYGSVWDWTEVAVTEPANQAPVADAGEDLETFTDQSTILDGTGSSDPDGDSLTYAWAVVDPEGTDDAWVTDPTAAQPGFRAIWSGVYTVQLTVTDQWGASSSDSVTISVHPELQVSDVTVGKDLQAGSVVYFYEQPLEPVDVTITVGDESIALVSPDGNTIGSRTLTFEDIGDNFPLLMFAQVQGLSAGTTTLTVNATGYPEINKTITVVPQVGFAFFTQDFSVDEAAEPHDVAVHLHPLNADGNMLHRQARRAGAPPVTVQLANSNDAVGTLLDSQVVFHPGSARMSTDFDPVSAGTTEISVIQPEGFTEPTDGRLSITATVTGPPNQAPIAEAGQDQTANTGDTVTLDGTDSTDPEGDTLTYAWTLATPEGSSATLTDPTDANPSFGADAAGTYTAELVVNDGTENSPADTVTITVGSQLVLSHITLGVDLQTSTPWTFTEDPPAPVDVTLTILDEGGRPRLAGLHHHWIEDDHDRERHPV